MADADAEHEVEEVAHQLLTIHRHLRRHSKQVSAELGIRGRQLAVLRRLHEVGAMSVRQLSNYLYVADSTMSELLAGMEAKGLVTRARSSEDNRVAVVTPTPDGELLAARAPLGGVALLRQRLRELPVERVRALADALACIAELMEITDANNTPA